MPLVRREDSVFVVVDAQPGFFDYEALAAGDKQRAAAAVQRITWMAGLAALLDVRSRTEAAAVAHRFGLVG